MKALRIFFTLSGAIAWFLGISVAAYLWLGGYFYARSAPLFDALVCAQNTSLHFPLNGDGGPYRPSACLRGIYARNSSADVATMNSDIKFLYAVLSLPGDGEAEQMFSYWTARGANVNIQSTLTGATLVEQFAKDGDADTVNLLIKHGAKIDLRNKAGQTPLEALHWFSEKYDKKPNAEVVKLLGG